MQGGLLPLYCVSSSRFPVFSFVRRAHVFNWELVLETGNDKRRRQGDRLTTSVPTGLSHEAQG